jgi:hypothetical protein
VEMADRIDRGPRQGLVSLARSYLPHGPSHLGAVDTPLLIFPEYLH